MKRFRRTNFLGAGPGAHRHVTTGRQRRHHRLDPVITTVLAAILDDAAPRLAASECRPHIAKRFGRHLGVTNNIVGLTDQLLSRKACRLYKIIIDIGNHAFAISPADDAGLRADYELLISHWLVDFHTANIADEKGDDNSIRATDTENMKNRFFRVDRRNRCHRLASLREMSQNRLLSTGKEQTCSKIW